MFYFDELNGCKILRSDYLDNVENIKVNAFFTTRDKNTPINKDLAKRIITPIQTHSNNVQIVDERNEYPDTDGLILTIPDTAIYLRFADCTPLIFYDSKNNIGAISHAGWRGTASKIGVKTVEKLVTNFKTNPDNLIVLIGPAISLCCYEVSDEVRDSLLSTVNNSDGLYKDRHVDLKGINKRQLEEVGVNKIDVCPYCTSCNNDLFYSYRKENGTKERHYAVLEFEICR